MAKIIQFPSKNDKGMFILIEIDSMEIHSITKSRNQAMEVYESIPGLAVLKVKEADLIAPTDED